jgi:hypothetical protein
MIPLRLFTGILLEAVPFFTICFYPCLHELRYRRSTVFALTAVIFCGLDLIYVFASMHIARQPIPKQDIIREVSAVNLLITAGLFCWYVFAFRGSIQKKLFLFIFSSTAELLMIVIVNTIAGRGYYQRTPGDLLPFDGSSLLLLFTCEAICVPFLYQKLQKYYFNNEELMDPEILNQLIWITAVIYLLFSTGLLFSTPDLIITPAFTFVSILVLFCALSLDTCFLQLMESAGRKRLLEQKYLQAEQQLSMQEEEYGSVQESIEGTRIQRHDRRHHILIMQDLLASGQYDAAKNYLRELSELQTYYPPITCYCQDTVLNMLLSHYQKDAEAHSIRFNAHIRIDCMPLPDAKLSPLLGNLLENAMRGASQAEGDMRFIQVGMITSGASLAITVDNGYGGDLNRADNTYASTKESHIGLGLKSVEETASQFGGHADFNDHDHVFYASVLLNLDRKSSEKKTKS